MKSGFGLLTPSSRLALSDAGFDALNTLNSSAMTSRCDPRGIATRFVSRTFTCENTAPRPQLIVTHGPTSRGGRPVPSNTYARSGRSLTTKSLLRSTPSMSVTGSAERKYTIGATRTPQASGTTALADSRWRASVSAGPYSTDANGLVASRVVFEPGPPSPVSSTACPNRVFVDDSV